MFCEKADDIAVTTGVGVTQCCEVGCIDCINYLSDECLFSCLTRLKCELRVAPDIVCGFNLCTCALSMWVEGDRVGRTNKVCSRGRGLAYDGLQDWPVPEAGAE